MSRGTRSAAAGKPLLGLVVALASVGLLLTVAACVDLTSTSPSVTAVVESTTTAAPVSTTGATTTTAATVEEPSAEPAPSAREEEEVTEPEPVYWEWGNSDEGPKSVHVGDHIKIRLDIDAGLQCASFEWELSDAGVLHNLGQAIAKEGPFIVKAVKNYEVIGAGWTQITAWGRWADGTLTAGWGINVTATE